MKLHVFPVGIILMLLLTGCVGQGKESGVHGDTSPEIRFTIENEAQYIDVVGIPTSWNRSIQERPLSDAEWQSVFAIVVDGGTQPMLGDYASDSNLIRFTPAFPLMSGQTYHATFLPEALTELRPPRRQTSATQTEVTETFTMPLATTRTTIVTEIYPSGDTLPSNLLRFYVYFSAPMREGNALDHITLVDANGNEVEGVFFDPIFELWDPSTTRLTLLFDPGRVKTGLQAHEALGRALVPGQGYTLTIGASMMDANGNHLHMPFEKSFVVVEPDLSPPDLAQWDVSSPVSGSRNPLILQFPAPLDHQLLAEFIQVRNALGDRIEGEITVMSKETEWHFIPDNAWSGEQYHLWVNTKLEDVAGNNLHGRFDTPPEDRSLHSGQTELMLPFQIK